jgi:signal transduction histidine kinase
MMTRADPAVPRLPAMPPPVRRDALLATAFLVWAELEVVSGTVHGSVPVNVLTALVCTSALAWRRTAPVTVALLVTGGLAFKTAWGLRLDGLALLSAILVASYSLGRHVPLRRAAAVVAAMLVLGWLSLFGLPPADQTLANYPFIALWICGPAAAGAALRGQVERAAQESARAVRAELEREDHARAAVAQERLRIARELHDTVAHAVSVMVLHTGAVRSRLDDGLDSERTALGEVEATGRRAIAELRRLLGVLRSDAGPNAAVAEPQPTLAGLDRLADETRRLGLRVDVEVVGEKPALEPGVEVSAYRILQEALTNVRKHADAQTVAVRLGYAADCVRLRVADDGRGANGGAGAGHGLVGIRERAEVYGGRVATLSPPGGGFVLEVELPVTAR